MTPEEESQLDQSDERRVAAANKVLWSHVVQLAEHFDSVQIIATSCCSQKGTSLYSLGGGNHYARVGSVEEWLRYERRK